MNIWITRLGSSPFSESDINRIRQLAQNLPSLRYHDIVRHSTEGIDYAAICTPADRSNKSYHHKSGDTLFAYSGLPVDKRTGEDDFRSAGNLWEKGKSPVEIAEAVAGQFALFTLSGSRFECITDCLGSYKVFWYQAKDQTVYVSNYLPFIQLFKPSQPNIEFLANWVAASGTYGCATEEEQVFTLPEFGRLTWSPKMGLHTEPYHKLSSLVLPESSYDELVNLTAKEWRDSARYLVSRHEVAVSLSGGYDSRLVLNMFRGLDSSRIESYTYPDHTYDIQLAKAVAADHGFPHEVLTPENGLPSLEEAHQFTVQNSYPFLCYSNVTSSLFAKKIYDIFSDHKKVKITGDGGDTHLGIKKFKRAAQQIGTEAIHTLADSLIRKEILTADGLHRVRSGLISHYSDKYLPFLPDHKPAEKLPTLHYYLERFANYQSYKLIHTRLLSDLFFAYGNENFLRSVFSAPVRELIRPEKNSLHHRLSRAFTNGEDKPIPFSKNLHWEAEPWDKLQFRVQRKHVRPWMEKLFGTKEKFSRRVQREFFSANQSRYREILASTPNSGLWDYLDRDVISGWLSDGHPVPDKNMKVLSRVVPLVKEGF